MVLADKIYNVAILGIEHICSILSFCPHCREIVMEGYISYRISADQAIHSAAHKSHLCIIISWDSCLLPTANYRLETSLTSQSHPLGALSWGVTRHFNLQETGEKPNKACDIIMQKKK